MIGKTVFSLCKVFLRTSFCSKPRSMRWVPVWQAIEDGIRDAFFFIPRSTFSADHSGARFCHVPVAITWVYDGEYKKKIELRSANGSLSHASLSPQMIEEIVIAGACVLARSRVRAYSKPPVKYAFLPSRRAVQRGMSWLQPQAERFFPHVLCIFVFFVSRQHHSYPDV